MAEAYICRRGGGGGRRVPVTLRGAPYTVVTCVPAEGGEAQSFALNGAGDAEITLKTGSYTFSNLLSLETGEAETAIYTVSAAVGEETAEVRLYPEGAIYWYGRAVQDTMLGRGGTVWGNLNKTVEMAITWCTPADNWLEGSRASGPGGGPRGRKVKRLIQGGEKLIKARGGGECSQSAYLRLTAVAGEEVPWQTDPYVGADGNPFDGTLTLDVSGYDDTRDIFVYLTQTTQEASHSLRLYALWLE